jgi:hypothetical protein
MSIAGRSVLPSAPNARAARQVALPDKRLRVVQIKDSKIEAELGPHMLCVTRYAASSLLIVPNLFLTWRFHLYIMHMGREGCMKEPWRSRRRLKLQAFS